MNIAMFTNTFPPQVSGVSVSVARLASCLRARGHSVLIVAPEFPHASADEPDVLRMPALQRVGGSDLSVPTVASRRLDERIAAFAPDLVHAHHPFLLGDTALRIASSRGIPVVFTYHTRYEVYAQAGMPGNSTVMQVALGIALGYSNLCDAVIAPSESTARFLRANEVTPPVAVIPSGIPISALVGGDGPGMRRALGIPPDAFLVGHVGRLAVEKNLDYLAGALTSFLARHPTAHALIAGDGPMRRRLARMFERAGLGGRVHFAGVVTGRSLADAYAAMDLFAFSSLSETQGLVLAEAMAAGVPVVALSGPGTEEIVVSGQNGQLLPADATPSAFAGAIDRILSMDRPAREKISLAARRTADNFSVERVVERTATLYRATLDRRLENPDPRRWKRMMRRAAIERDLIANLAHAIGGVVAPSNGLARVSGVIPIRVRGGRSDGS